MVCRSCAVDKDIEEFPLRGYGQRRKDCRGCHLQQRRDNYDPERAKAGALRNMYGITIDQYKAMEARQGGRCAICNEVPETRLYVDHDHTTGEVRGLLCTRCNVGLGMFRDNPEYLDAATQYITGP
jgi:hypothetical protein